MENQLGMVDEMIKTEDRNMRKQTQNFISMYTLRNDTLRLHAHVGGGEQVSDAEREKMLERVYAKAWLTSQERVHTGGQLGGVMRSTLGGREDMWSEMITCREESLPKDLQKQLNEHMKTVKQLKTGPYLGNGHLEEQYRTGRKGDSNDGGYGDSNDGGYGGSNDGGYGDSNGGGYGGGQWARGGNREQYKPHGGSGRGWQKTDKSHVQCHKCGRYVHFMD
jgi:hypothetical protein